MPKSKTIADQLQDQTNDEMMKNLNDDDSVEVLAELGSKNKAVESVVVIKQERTDHEDNDQPKSHVDDTSQEIKAQEITQEVVKAQARDKAQDKVQDVQDATQEVAKGITKEAQALKSQVVQEVDDVKAQVHDKVQDTAQAVQEATQELKAQISDGTETARDKAADLKDKATELKSEIAEEATSKFQDVKTQVADKAQDLKAGLDDRLHELKDLKENVASTLSAKTDTIKDSIHTSLQAGKDATSHYSDTHPDVGALAGLLGKAGAFIGALYDAPKKDYQGVDLSQAVDVRANAFYGQSAALGKQLFGAKVATAQSVAQRFVSGDKLEGFSGKLYQKIAEWAGAWAQKSLQNDSRFARVHELTDAQKDMFAADIANQNRALATLGGVAGLAGLKGVVADTAWLLAVCLRTVYQLAAIYGVSLDGKDGVSLAYGVLSGANLDKLQEKQVLLTALALGNTVLASGSVSLKDEIAKVGGNTGWFDSYQSQLDELGKYVNLEKYNLNKLNFGWARRLLPVTSVAVGAYYNKDLIDEVIGTALATFKSGPPLLIEQKPATQASVPPSDPSVEPSDESKFD